ncbi:MAG: AAA family ATPase [Candidatus Omnitrophota bacterium]
MKQLLILRGRPGAGKSSVAKNIQQKLEPKKVAIFTPDYFYWQVFPGEDNKNLVNKVLNFAIQKYLEENYLVILEGILPKNENGELFESLYQYCQNNDINFNSVFLEVSLEKALKRNRKRKKGTEISDSDMKTWYSNAQPKEIINEKILKTDNKTAEKITNKLLQMLVPNQTPG